MSFGSEPNPFAAANVPFTPPKPPSGAGNKLKGPAIGLLILAPLGIVFAVVDLAYRIININGGVVLPGNLDPQFADSVKLGIYFGMAGDVACMVCQVIVMIGAVSMLKLWSRSLAYAGSIVSLIPCLSACCVLGIPFGIWAIVTLNDPQVRADFRG